MTPQETGAAAGCLLLSFLFSAAEAALLAIEPRSHGEALAAFGRRGAVVDRLLGQPRAAMAAILVANMTANALLTALVAAVLLRDYGLLRGALLAALLVTGLISLVGELVPKVLATKYPVRMAALTAYPVAAASFLLRPFTGVADKVVRSVTGSDDLRGRGGVTEEELRSYLVLSSTEGVLGAGESEMIDSIFEFGETAVHEVMTPRMDIYALPETATLAEVRAVLAESQRSRLPVYREDLDDIVGVLYVKDLLPYLAGAEPGSSFRLSTVLRKTHFVPEVMKCDDLLRDLRQQGRFLAVVVDEYGGTAGIVTMEDLLEEIVGEIRDEYDDDEEPRLVEALAGGGFAVDARLHVEEAEEDLPFEFPEGEFDTVGGFVFNGLGHLPEVGEEMTWDRWTFRVTAMEGHRIRRVEVRPAPPVGGEAP